MKKKVFLSLFIVLILFSGCDSKQEKAMIKQSIEQGKINAVNYIKEKYGIDSIAINGEVKRIQSFGGSPTTDPTTTTYIEMKFNNEKFYVMIDGGKVTTDGYDNRQFETIKKDIVSYIDNIVGSNSIDNDINFGMKYKEYKGLIKPLYKNNDFKEINNKLIVIEYSNNVNLSNVKNKNVLKQSLFSQSGYGKILLITYNFESDTNKVNTHTYGLSGTEYKESLYENGLYIKEALYIDNEEEKYYSFKPNSYDGIYYADFNTNSQVNIINGEKIDGSNFEGRGTWNVKSLTETYNVSTSAKTVYIYYPTSKINNYKNYKEFYVGTSYIDNGERIYYAQDLKHSKVGDYYVFNIPFYEERSNFSFTILGK